MIPRLIRSRFRALEIVAPDKNRHMGSVFRQEHGLFRRRESAAHDENFLTGKKFAVAGSAVGHAMPAEIQLPLKADCPGMCARRNQNAETFIIAFACRNLPHVPGQIQSGHFRKQKFRAETLRLTAHGFRQFLPAGTRHAGIIDHLGGNGNLSAEGFLLNDENPVAGAGQIDSGGQSGGAASYDNHIIEVLNLFRHQSAPTRSRLGLRVSAPGCHFAGQTWSPCSATN